MSTSLKVLEEKFTINGTKVGNISAENAKIPAGDFGSNDCYTSGDSCDELYIARMGAGCDCYYFEGIIDDVTIAFEEKTVLGLQQAIGPSGKVKAVILGMHSMMLPRSTALEKFMVRIGYCLTVQL